MARTGPACSDEMLAIRGELMLLIAQKASINLAES
jgi:hypothetical protein